MDFDMTTKKLPPPMDAKTGKVTKNTWDASRGAAPNMFDPEDLVIRGIDTKDKQDGVLVDITTRHDDAKILKLALNLIKVGQIHDVVIMKDGDKPVVTDGRRRVLAFRMVNRWVRAGDPRAEGLKEPLKVSCKTKRGSEGDHMMLMVSGNEHAEPDTPLSKARKALRLANLGIPVADIAIGFGVTTQAVDAWLKLAELHTDVQKAIDAGVIPADAGLALAALSREEQLVQLNEALEAAASKVDASAPTGRAAPKVTGKEMRARVAGQENAAPGKRQLNKILAAVLAEELDISEIDSVKLLKWVVGKVPTSQLKGFTKVLEG